MSEFTEALLRMRDDSIRSLHAQAASRCLEEMMLADAVLASPKPWWAVWLLRRVWTRRLQLQRSLHLVAAAHFASAASLAQAVMTRWTQYEDEAN